MPGFFQRAIRPPDDVTPNPNDPGSVPPATVGPDQLVTPGDPHGVTVEDTGALAGAPPRIIPSPWSGWPADWWTPAWGGSRNLESASDVAWMCLDLNASLLATMPPYLVGARDGLEAGWITNPDPDLYTSWEEFAKQLFWDYQLGEAFVRVTARYATGWPARFHVVPGWLVNVELDGGGTRSYTIGNTDVTDDILHIRYRSTIDDAHGHGPLEVGQYRILAAKTLAQYGATLATAGGIPSSILTHPEELSAAQAAELQAQWVQARLSKLGEPAVLSGGVTWQATQMNADEMALMPLLEFNESRIAYLLGVPAFLVGLPSASGESMTYSNVSQVFDSHWRAHLRPKAQSVMAALSEWLLPRGTIVEVNRDAYVRPGPYERAQTAQILAGIVDPVTGQQALTVAEIRAAERLDDSSPNVAQGVLR